MPNHIDSVVDVAKKKMREEIDQQVELFLKRGGRIDVLLPPEPAARHERGSVWHSPNEFADVRDD
ncbi:hypothetical protein [Parahalioglobus pacificus]|uniref:Transcriptional regulator SutA RNAP-binding domain-containing protein n=1 Tax=Parahalioglobus pacificus TaxID=930806 RepID=A0A918XHK0_9GAMM|nr:hypothetical protein [Halioglobus pacificus]GHD31015.1 hypothetical protein GCM10007053_13570 [Halioglobus pacificus]